MPDAPAAAPNTPNPTGDQPSPSATPSQALPPSHVSRRQLGQPQRVIARQPSKVNAPIAPAPKVEPAKPADATVAPAAVAGPADTPRASDTPAAAAPEPDKAAEQQITAAEGAKRLARINRADQKLQADRRAFAQVQQQHAQSLQRAQQLEAHFRGAHQEVQADPLAFLQRTFGISPQAVLDRVIAEGAKPETTRAQEAQARELAEFRARQQEMDEWRKRQEQQSQQQLSAQQIAMHKATQIVPVLESAPDKYKLTLQEHGGQGAVDQIFALQVARLNLIQQGKMPANSGLTPQAAADMIEAHYQSLRDRLNGTNVAPAKLSAPPRSEPAKPSNGSQTANRTGMPYAPARSFSIRAKQ